MTAFLRHPGFKLLALLTWLYIALLGGVAFWHWLAVSAVLLVLSAEALRSRLSEVLLVAMAPLLFYWQPTLSLEAWPNLLYFGLLVVLLKQPTRPRQPRQPNAAVEAAPPPALPAPTTTPQRRIPPTPAMLRQPQLGWHGASVNSTAAQLRQVPTPPTTPIPHPPADWLTGQPLSPPTRRVARRWSPLLSLAWVVLILSLGFSVSTLGPRLTEPGLSFTDQDFASYYDPTPSLSVEVTPGPRTEPSADFRQELRLLTFDWPETPTLNLPDTKPADLLSQLDTLLQAHYDAVTTRQALQPELLY